jgi:hypothetical protein
MRLIHELQQFVSSDTTLCLDMGSFHLWIARHLHSFKPRQVLISNGQSIALGYRSFAGAGRVRRSSLPPETEASFFRPWNWKRRYG